MKFLVKCGQYFLTERHWLSPEYPDAEQHRTYHHALKHARNFIVRTRDTRPVRIYRDYGKQTENSWQVTVCIDTAKKGGA